MRAERTEKKSLKNVLAVGEEEASWFHIRSNAKLLLCSAAMRRGIKASAWARCQNSNKINVSKPGGGRGRLKTLDKQPHKILMKNFVLNLNELQQHVAWLCWLRSNTFAASCQLFHSVCGFAKQLPGPWRHEASLKPITAGEHGLWVSLLTELGRFIIAQLVSRLRGKVVCWRRKTFKTPKMDGC